MKRAMVWALLLLLWGCQSEQHRIRSAAWQEWADPNGRLKVLSTTRMIQDIVREVGGEQILPLALITGQLDPHSYQLVKGDDERLALADVIFYNGLGLEHGPSLRYALESSGKAVPLGETVRQKFPERMIFHEGQIDPHIWMDVSLWREIVPEIVQVLSVADPSHASVYAERGERLKEKLSALHASLRHQMQTLPREKRFLVTSHDAFNYFARAYLATDEEQAGAGWRRRFAAPEGLAPESQLSPQDIREIIDYVSDRNISVIFPESNVSQQSLKKIVEAGREEGLDVVIASHPLFGDAMGGEGATYFTMLQQNVQTLQEYLQR